MKRSYIVFVFFMAAFCMCAREKPRADVFLRVTSELPKWSSDTGYSGYFSVTNTGTVPFVIITDEEWSGEATRFYREGDGERQLMEDSLGGAAKWKEDERAKIAGNYYFSIDQKKPHATLKPGEGITFYCKTFYFNYRFSAPADIYKAEMFLGYDTWVPVRITPTLGTLFAVSYKKGKPDGDFYYSKEGTNQYLYLKEGGQFKRVGEIKAGSKPKPTEDGVTFNSTDGSTKEITRTTALQIIQKHEKEQKKDE